MRRDVVALVMLLGGMFVAAPSFAESADEETTESESSAEKETDDSEETTESEDEGGDDQKASDEASGPANFGAGNFDAGVGLAGNLAYFQVEPMVDLGLIPVDGKFTFSAGGMLAYGYCLFCSVVSAVSGVTWNISHVTPQGRLLVHMNQVADVAWTDQLDTYAGFSAGPTVYTFSLASDSSNDRVTASHWSFRIVPQAGVRFFLGGNDVLFLTGEARWAFEFFTGTVTVSDNRGNELTYEAEDYRSSGWQFLVGAGIRL